MSGLVIGLVHGISSGGSLLELGSWHVAFALTWLVSVRWNWIAGYIAVVRELVSEKTRHIWCQNGLLSSSTPIVLVCLGCYTINTIDLVAKTMKFYFSQFWRLGCPRSKYLQIWCLMRAHFLVRRWLKQRKCIPLHCWRLEDQDQSVSRLDFLWGLFPWPLGRCLLPISSRGLLCVLIIWIKAHPCTLFYLKYFFEGWRSLMSPVNRFHGWLGYSKEINPMT